MHVLLHFTRAQKADDRYAFRFGREEYQLHGEGRSVRTAALNWNEALIEDLEMLRGPGEDLEAAQRVGGKLRRFLASAGWSRREAEIEGAVQSGEPVYITISSAAAELYALPWELLTIEATGQSLGELPGVLIRYAWPGTDSTANPPDTRQEGGRILLACSDAAGFVPLEAHRDAINDACQHGHYNAYFDPERDVLGQVSLDRLAHALRDAERSNRPISILHILCHGTSRSANDQEVFGLSWYDDNEREAFVGPDQLRAFLSQDVAKQIRLVVLSACDSSNSGALGNQLGGVAQAAHQAGVPAVIASRFPLSIRGSVRLVEGFYDHLLGQLSSLEQAFLAGRRRLLQSSSNLDWASVQLYARPEDGDDTRPVVFRPYRGLLAFEAEHTRFFFGRDAERAEIQDDLDQLASAGKPRFLVVAGASGTGKSSLVMSGAVPDLVGERTIQEAPGDLRPRLDRALAQIEEIHGLAKNPFLLQAAELLRRGASELGSGANNRWQYAVMRLGNAPLLELERALAKRIDPRAPFLLVVDQFEELFTHTEQPEVRQKFAQTLWQLANGNTGVYCVITIRVDFLGACGEIVLDEVTGLHLETVAYDEAHRVFVAKMARDQLVEAIEKPARRVGLELQEGLVDRILDDVGNEPGALPLMQYTLDLLWQERDGRTLTLAAYQELGGSERSGVVGALQKKADKVIASLSDEQHRRQARRLLVRLVKIGDEGVADTRRRVPIDELEPKQTEQRAVFTTVLDALVGARLLVRSEEGGRATVEVAHEALIRKWPLLRRWMEEDRVKLRQLVEIERWTEEWRKRHTCLSGRQLGYALQIQDKYGDDLDPDTRTMIQASEERAQNKAKRERRRRQQWRLVAAVMALMSVASLVLWINARRNRASALESREEAVLKAEEALREKENAEESRDKANAAQSMATSATRVAGARSSDDPAISAALLREETINTTGLWIQAALDTLQQPMANRVLAPPPGYTLIAAKADGSRLIARDHGSKLLIYSPDAEAQPIELASGDGSFESVQMSEDGNRLLAMHSDGFARLWDTFTGETLWQSPVAVTAAAASADGRQIAIADSAKRLIEIWDTTGDTLSVISRWYSKHTKPVTTIAFNPKGDRLLTGSQDNTGRIWHIKQRRQVRHLVGHRAELTAVAFSPNGEYAITTSRDRTARVWQAVWRNQRRFAKPVVLSHRHQVLAASFRDNTRVVTATSDGQAREWNVFGRGEPSVFRGHQRSLQAIFAKGDAMVTIDAGGDARQWNLASNKRSFEMLRGHSDAVISAAFTSDQKAITASRDGRLCLWNGESCELLNRADTSEIRAMGICRENGWAATASGSHVWRWHLDNDRRQQMAIEPEPTSVITSLSLSPTCETMLLDVSGEHPRLVSMVGDAGRSRKLRIRSGLAKASFSPDGERLLTIARNGNVQVWNAKTGRLERALDGSEDPIRSATFDKVGTTIMAGSATGKVIGWDLTSQDSSYLELGDRHRAAVVSIRFSDGEECLVTGSDDDTARVWVLDDRCPFAKGATSRGAGTAYRELVQHKDSVVRALFNEDATRLVTASVDGTVRLWNASRDITAAISAHGEAITALAMSGDGNRIIVGTADGAAQLIRARLDTKSLKEELSNGTSLCVDDKTRQTLFGVLLPSAGNDSCSKPSANGSSNDSSNGSSNDSAGLPTSWLPTGNQAIPTAGLSRR